MGGTSVNIDRERQELSQRLKSKERRDAFVSASVDETIPFRSEPCENSRIESGRRRLATRTGMKQERISTLENPNYGSYSLRILKQLASAFDVALMVRFVPFSQLVEWKLHLSWGLWKSQVLRKKENILRRNRKTLQIPKY